MAAWKVDAEWLGPRSPTPSLLEKFASQIGRHWPHRLVPIYPKYLVTRSTQFDPTALLIEYMHKKGEGELKL